MKNSGRYYPLIDEIKNHVFQWATEEDWKKIPPALNAALTSVMNELKIYESLKAIGQQDERTSSSEKQDKIDFIAIFKQKYLEFTDLNYRDRITPVHQLLISKNMQLLRQEGSSPLEFLEWFFDDFATQERNKQFMPPTISFTLSSFVVNKFLYQMKEMLKMRKRDIDNMAVSNMLLNIAIPFLEETKDKDLSLKVLAFSQKELTVKKFMELLIGFAEKYNKKDIVDKIKTLMPDKAK